MSIQIRKKRARDHFWASNQLIRRDGAELGVYAVVTYCAIATFADNATQSAFPSLGTLARTVGCSKNTIRKALKALEDTGWISIERRFDNTRQRYESSEYYLLHTPGARDLASGDGSSREGGGAPDEPGVVHEVNQGGAPHEPGGGSPRDTELDSLSELDSDNYIAKTSDDVSAEDSRPLIFLSPEQYTVREITHTQLTRQQWETLLENEQTGKARKTVIAHCRAKLSAHPLAPRRAEMLAAMDQATSQDYSDPGMAAAFQQVLGKLWPAENYYTPEEVNRFVADNGPVANVYWLPGELSTWRNTRSVRKKGQQVNGKDKQHIQIPGSLRDYNRDGLGEFRREWDQGHDKPAALPPV